MCVCLVGNANQGTWQINKCLMWRYVSGRERETNLQLLRLSVLTWLTGGGGFAEEGVVVEEVRSVDYRV